jgi:hypothetical protein
VHAVTPIQTVTLSSSSFPDIHGWKKILLLGTAWSVIFSLASSFAQNQVQLDIL